MRVCIDVDDYHSFPKWDCTDVLFRFVERFPEIKFTLFFTPFMRRIPATDYPQSLERLRELIDRGNVELHLHGLTHLKYVNGEFGAVPRIIAKRRILRSIRLAEKCGLPFQKGYKFPWHLYNRSCLRVLDELGFILFSKNHEPHFRGRQVNWRDGEKMKKRFIQTDDYSHGKPQAPFPGDTVYYYGHAQNVRLNGIRESSATLFRELSELQGMADVRFAYSSDLAE